MASRGRTGTLGLDIGTNSIGWALVDEEQQVVAAMGSRVFSTPMEPDKKDVPKNAARRAKRAARRLTRRRVIRRNQLLTLLRQHGMIPAENVAAWHQIDPYSLRAKGLNEALTLEEFGRALFHLAQRRGYQSNRKSAGLSDVEDPAVQEIIERKETEERLRELEALQKRREKAAAKGKDPNAAEDEKVVLAAIAELKQILESQGMRTLGEYFHHRLQKGLSVRRTYTERGMYQHEFEALWTAQTRHHPLLQNDELRAQFFHAIFFQRPLRRAVGVVGACQFERSRNRAPKANPIAHEFRIWQQLNHLLYLPEGSSDWMALTQDQKNTVAAALQEAKELSWSKFRTLTGIKKDAQINLEPNETERITGIKSLSGNATHIELQRRTNGRWSNMTEDEQAALFEDLHTIDHKGKLVRRLRQHWQFSPEETYDLATLELEMGHAMLSTRAMRRILTHLKQGLNYHDAVVAAGYAHNYQKEVSVKAQLPEVPKSITNPVVRKALNQTRRLVNAIIAEYGLPQAIRIEMGRDLALSKKDRQEIEKANKRNAELNQQAKAACQAQGIAHPSPTDLQKYRLWVECNGVCPYTGREIGLHQLFTQDIDIEHILPFSRSQDDSMANKTLCYAHENREVKRNRTPYEAYGNTPRWEEMRQRVARFKCGRHKKKLFSLQEIPEGFVERQLNDTRYITRQVLQFCQDLGCEVTATTGKATAALRHQWGLNSLLGEDGQKNRLDHRHHALDALVVAFTTLSLYQKIARAAQGQKGGYFDRTWQAPEPWDGFRHDVRQALDKVVVSHQINRKVTGPLHEETAYGRHKQDGSFMVRKSVNSLTANEVERIIDPTLRKRVRAWIEEVGPKRQATEAFFFVNRHGEKVEVRRVRIRARAADPSKMFAIRDKSGQPYKYHPYGSNHHAVIYEHKVTGERSAEVVTMAEAARRGAQGESVYQPRPPVGWRTVMVLHNGDVVRWEDDELYRVTTIAAGEPLIMRLQFITYAKPTLLQQYDKQVTNSRGLRQISARVRVDMLGRVWPDP